MLFLSIICSKCGSKDEKIFKEKESIKILHFLNLISNIEQCQKNMTEKNMGQKFRLKEIDRKRNYFSEEKNPNELIR